MIPAPDLPISFGICVGPNWNDEWLTACIKSIEDQNIPEYEIILSFDKFNADYRMMKYFRNDMVIHQLGEWLPKKKNTIAEIAKYDTLVIVHDYYLFDDDWYDGVKEYNASIGYNNWDLMNNFVLRLEDSERGPDWVINPQYMKKFLDNPANSDILSELKNLYPTENHPMYVVGLSPHEKNLTPLQYVSGGFIMCKRKVLLSVPFNEDMKPGESEDLEWFERVKKSTDKFKLTFNTFSIVYTQKPNKWRVFQLPMHHVERLRGAMNQGFFANA